MTKHPIVSVIMTVYNGEAYLLPAVESIRNQSMADFEFVIVDDGSIDGTKKILSGYQSDTRINIITCGRIGRAAALNVAWKRTNGKFIANLDSDDLSEPDRLEKQVSFLKLHPDIGMLGTAWNRFSHEKEPSTVVQPPTQNEILRRTLIKHYPFIHSSIMFRRQVLESVQGYNEKYKVSIDYEIAARVACHFEIANLPEVLTWKRAHQTYFNSISYWERYKSVVAIRWLVWSKFSKRPAELANVFNPWGMLRRHLGRWYRYSLLKNWSVQKSK